MKKYFTVIYKNKSDNYVLVGYDNTTNEELDDKLSCSEIKEVYEIFEDDNYREYTETFYQNVDKVRLLNKSKV